ncbi:hypothetical protein V8G54_000298 [Vigna mungo]|uniref:Uncharacterized protein n=1 Tax=Vigna mungo TaxID=3915 RepID=A0AAQ3SAN0_VIGMU
MKAYEQKQTKQTLSTFHLFRSSEETLSGMAFGSSEDVSAIKLLLLLAVMYGLVSALTYSVVHLKFVNPLGNDAPLDRFSEGRTIQHVRMLSQEIDGRQEGRPGLKKAAEYIKGQLEVLKERASSNVRIEIEETTVSGSFNMLFLGHNIALGYRNHTNIIMRYIGKSIWSFALDSDVYWAGYMNGILVL